MADSRTDSEYPIGSAPAGVEPPTPPPAPEFDRRAAFEPLRVAGLLLIAAAPILALFGLFGVSNRDVTASSETLSVSVSYPVTQRFKVRAPLRITITNIGETTLARARISLLAPYIKAFSDVAMTPCPERIADDDYVFELTDIAAGESRHLNMEMQAQSYWRAAGLVTWSVIDASGQSTDSGSAEFSTFTWP